MSGYCCPILTKTAIYRQIFVELPNIFLNSLRGSSSYTLPAAGQTSTIKLIRTCLQLFLVIIPQTRALRSNSVRLPA